MVPSQRHRWLRTPRLGALLAALLALGLAIPASSDNRDRAKRIFDRLAGVPPSEAQLSTMVGLLGGVGGTPSYTQLLDAADVALDDPSFYNVSLVNFVTPWTNVERTVYADLNDYTATVIGMIRDGVPFDQVLTADLVYVAGPGAFPTPTPYDHANNEHYRDIQSFGIDLSDPNQLTGVPQSTLPGAVLTSSDAAGVVTTRAAAEAFFSAGTNRRMWRFTSLNFLCRDLEALKDTSRPADRIRQDVSRSPGGDSEIFHTQCVGCHAGQDALAGAYAYYEWDADQERLLYTRGQVQGKYAINTGVFPGGYVTTDDSWRNFWRVGQNAALGWSESEVGEGFGAKGLGAEVAHSRAFAECQVQKVFEHVCFRGPQTDLDATRIQEIADDFELQGSYDMRRVFADVAIHCSEGE
jgi:hypothetical protein